MNKRSTQAMGRRKLGRGSIRASDLRSPRSVSRALIEEVLGG